MLAVNVRNTCTVFPHIHMILACKEPILPSHPAQGALMANNAQAKC